MPHKSSFNHLFVAILRENAICKGTIMKKIRMVILALGLTAALAGCNKKVEEPKETKEINETQMTEKAVEETKNNTDDTSQGEVISYLTGESVSTEIGRQRPIAVMLNNIVDAVPQAGIANAGVVYEAPVEGNMTRLMGIFEDYHDLEKIGSVRSCRNYYVYYAQEFNSIYAHFGQAVYALPLLELEEVNNLSGLDGSVGSSVYYRTSDRVAPHNAYTSAEGLDKGIEIKGYDMNYSESYKGHYQFAADNQEVNLDGVKANTVKPGYTNNKPWFEYDEKDKLYYRFQYDDKQIDELTEEQLSYKNIIFQYSKWENFDSGGYLNIDTTSGGEGKYITNGTAIDITWEKDSEWGATKYYDKSGKEITLNQGKTWVCIILEGKTDAVEITE
jgi:hypothetical protein